MRERLLLYCSCKRRWSKTGWLWIQGILSYESAFCAAFSEAMNSVMEAVMLLGITICKDGNKTVLVITVAFIVAAFIVAAFKTQCFGSFWKFQTSSSIDAEKSNDINEIKLGRKEEAHSFFFDASPKFLVQKIVITYFIFTCMHFNINRCFVATNAASKNKLKMARVGSALKAQSTQRGSP